MDAAFRIRSESFRVRKTGGDMRVRGIDSEIYTDEDYLAAVQAVIAGFRDFQGCTLTEISYAGDETVQKEQEYILSFGDYDEGIVLLSSFTVDEHGGDGSLEPNHTYTRWSWYLARKNGGKWKIVTSGYG